MLQDVVREWSWCGLREENDAVPVVVVGVAAAVAAVAAAAAAAAAVVVVVVVAAAAAAVGGTAVAVALAFPFLVRSPSVMLSPAAFAGLCRCLFPSHAHDPYLLPSVVIADVVLLGPNPAPATHIPKLRFDDFECWMANVVAVKRAVHEQTEYLQGLEERVRLLGWNNMMLKPSKLLISSLGKIFSADTSVCTAVTEVLTRLRNKRRRPQNR